MNHNLMFFRVQCLGCLLLFPLVLAAAPPVYIGEITATFPADNARQGVAVDAEAFYSVDNRRLVKHDKVSGTPVMQWPVAASDNNPLIHMDSGLVLNGRLYVAHSNYPDLPMTGSVEVWDSATFEHLASHEFPSPPGSFTWIDHDGDNWWGAFANYDLVIEGRDGPYGETRNTVIVKMTEDFRILSSWTLPQELVARLTPMSNSGGSWSQDGLLYLTGHDRDEIYVMRATESSPELEWIATVQVPAFAGQGIAWDRSADEPLLWGIHRGALRVITIRMPQLPELESQGLE